ncbi:hypothetical protein ACWPM1_07685 [Tsuneonella sp. HG249]
MSEGWESVVASMLADDRRANSRKVSSATLTLLANLLDKNELPASGRAHVANVLRAVAEDDPEAILPKAKKPRGSQPVAIFAAVEREHCLRGGLKGEKGDAQESVGRRHGLKRSTVSRMASQGRSVVKAKLQAEIEAGLDRARLLDEMAQTLSLNVSVIEDLLLD